MKFILYTSAHTYTSGEEVEKLKKLGFTFTEEGSEHFFKGALLINGAPSIEIGSIEELIELSKQLECPLIIDYRNDYLEIYNDLRE